MRNLERQEFRQLQQACAYLFSPDHAKNPAFIKSLDTGKIKRAFRTKAKRYHPDRHRNEGPELRLQRKERFIRIKASYEFLSHTLKPVDQAVRPPAPASPAHRPQIIAVGGAKGGIGKSLFAANLAIFLAGQGYRTVAVDLDLGGANLHLYMGKPRLKKTINDFLIKKTDSLSRILEPTDYGVALIGGDSSCLGAGNVGFARKLKLLKAIRKLDADVVVADLGGDTAFNVLDFFLTADTGIVMTTSEPAAYLEAYAFIKVALYRKLTRIFGPESFYQGPGDPALRRLIQEAIAAVSSDGPSSIAHLRTRIREEARSGLGILDSVLSQFSPYILVNKLRENESGLSPVRRIQDVSAKTLTVNVRHLGNLPLEPGLETSARTLTPFVTTPASASYQNMLAGLTQHLI